MMKRLGRVKLMTCEAEKRSFEEKKTKYLVGKIFFQGELFKQSLGKHCIYLIQKDLTQDKSRQTLSCHHSPEEANLEIWSVQVPPGLGVVL